MRKFKILGLLLTVVFLLSGCSQEQVLTCTNSEEDGGIKFTQTVKMTFQQDSVTNISLVIDSEVTDDAIKDNWSSFVEMMDEQFSESKKDGITLSKSNDEESYTYKVQIDIDTTKASDDDLTEYGFDGIADVSATYEETKKEAEEDGFTCS